MQAVTRVVAARLPAQLLTQRLQGVQNAGLIGALAVIAQEEAVASGSGHQPVSAPGIRAQRLGNARMQGYQTLLVEFGFPDMQNARLEVDIGGCQRECFRDGSPVAASNPKTHRHVAGRRPCAGASPLAASSSALSSTSV